MLRNLFILLTAIVMGLFTINSQYQEVKMHRIWQFLYENNFFGVILILAFTRKEFILIGDLAFGGRTSVMVLVLIEIADAFIDRKNNSTQVNKKEQFTASRERQRRK